MNLSSTDAGPLKLRLQPLHLTLAARLLTGFAKGSFTVTGKVSWFSFGHLQISVNTEVGPGSKNLF